MDSSLKPSCISVGQWLCKTFFFSQGAQSEPLRTFVVFSQKVTNVCVFSLIGDMMSSKHSSK